MLVARNASPYGPPLICAKRLVPGLHTCTFLFCYRDLSTLWSALIEKRWWTCIRFICISNTSWDGFGAPMWVRCKQNSYASRVG